MSKTKLKKNDLVKIISGKYKGATGKVIQVDGLKSKIIVEGVNVVKKAVKKKTQQDKGGIIEVEAPLHISNVQLLSKGSTSRISYKINAKEKIRIAKKTGEEL